MSKEDNNSKDKGNESLAMRRDYDSVDDFEHVSHDGSSPEAVKVDDLMELKNDPIKSDPMPVSSIIDNDDDIKNDSRAVPATPPPSADFEKFEAMARSSDPFQSSSSNDDTQFRQNVFDPKAVTMAFMETERSFAPVSSLLHDKVTDSVSAVENLKKDLTKSDEPLNPLESHKIVEEKVVESIDNLSKDKDAKVGNLMDDLLINLPGKEEVIGDICSIKSTAVKDLPKEIHEEFLENIESSVLPAPEKSPSIDFLGGDITSKDSSKTAAAGGGNIMDDDSWNIVEHKEDKIIEDHMMAPTKPLPPLPKEADIESDRSSNVDKYEMSNDFLLGESSTAGVRPKRYSGGGETGDSEFESEPEPSPAKLPLRASTTKPQEVSTGTKDTTTRVITQQPVSSGGSSSRRIEDIEIAPKHIFRDMGLDAWFNPDRLNPKVAALIYWRDPKKSGIVFGATLVLLLSLAYFSLISVLAYLSLTVLTCTAAFRIYKTVLQAVQKTSDGHPFKDILDVDLTVPAEKVHEVADVAVAHANAAVSELRRLFLVEDFVDSVKFGVSLWCLTYVGSWFNGMTLIIIGVVALFTLPKVYETNKAQIDQNLTLMQGKVNELTAKVKAAIPLGKKSEPTKEE